MAVGDGAKGVGKLDLLRVRDIRALRVRVLNTVRLQAHLVGDIASLREELDEIGVEDGDPRKLLTRSLQAMHDIMREPGLKASMRWRAAKTIAEVMGTLRADELRARTTVTELAQQSQEHADRMNIENRKLELLELGDDSDDDRERLRRIAGGAIAGPGANG